MHRTDKNSQHSWIIWPVWLNYWVLVDEVSGCGIDSRCSHWNFRFPACFAQGVPLIQATIECGFTLKHTRDMIRTYSQMQRTDKYSQQSPIISPVSQNGWEFVNKLNNWGFQTHYSHLNFTLKQVLDIKITDSQFQRTDKYSQHSSIILAKWLVFIYELSGCGLESSCSHFNFRFRACFEQGVPWH